MILAPEPGEAFDRDGYEVCSSVVIERGLLIMYVYSVDCAIYVFIWITFLDGEGDEWEVEYWGDMSSVFSLWGCEVFCNEFVVVVVLLICIVCDEVVNVVLVSGFSFGVKEFKLILPLL